MSIEKMIPKRSIDINRFTLYNQLYGREAGDRCIKYVSACPRNYVKRFRGMAGYACGDSFYYLRPPSNRITPGRSPGTRRIWSRCLRN